MPKRKTRDEPQLEKQIAVRLTADDYERVERLAAHVGMSAIARVALLLGLDAIERNPAVLIGDKPKR